MIETTHKLKSIYAFIVWHKGEANIFKDETSAMDYISIQRHNDPAIQFNGWRQSVSGKNMVCLLSPYDEVYMHDKAAEMLMPKPE